MQEFVVVHARRIDETSGFDDVLLIHKQKPKWMAGRLNLVGGKVEANEDALAAAVRELKEEAGLDPLPNHLRMYCGSIRGEVVGQECIVHCVRLDVDPDQPLAPRPEETEKVEWFTFKDAWQDHRLMPNLRVIVPLMHLGVRGWELSEQSSTSLLHEVRLVVPTMYHMTF